jgi:hypothetical protein
MYTLEQYNSLVAAIAQGAMRVKYGDKEVEYRSLNEMLTLKGLIEKSLFPNKSNSGRTYASFSKGIK